MVLRKGQASTTKMMVTRHPLHRHISQQSIFIYTALFYNKYWEPAFIINFTRVVQPPTPYLIYSYTSWTRNFVNIVGFKAQNEWFPRSPKLHGV